MSAIQTPSINDDKQVVEKGFTVSHVECSTPTSAEPDNLGNLAYTNDEEEPVLHKRTYFAVMALFLLNYAQVVGLTGTPAILEFIGEDLNGKTVQVWVPNALSLVQAVGGPLLSFASDTFQARKFLLISTATVSFIGAAIAPGSKDIYRLIVAQILIGVGFASVPLAYAIPSEILPRKWRPATQSLMNIAASLGATTGPIVGGACVRIYGPRGWRYFFWVQMALWGATAVGILVGYHPPKRHTRLDHLSFKQKLGKLDLPGMALLTVGLTLLLAGLTLGGNPWAWSNVRVLATLIPGFAFLAAFGVYEWKGTSTGILHHELFHNRIFPICVILMIVEGIMLFSIIVFYPAITVALFEKEPLKMAARTCIFWLTSGAATVVYGFWSSSRRTIRSPLIAGFAIYTAGVVGIATIQPGQNVNILVFDALCGLGFASPLILLIAGVQLASPHHLIATATAVLTSGRAIAGSVFTAVYGAAVASGMSTKLPGYTAAAAVGAGLPPDSVAAFVGGMLGGDPAAAQAVPGFTPAVMEASVKAIAQATADSFRTVYIIAAPFGAAACLVAWFLPDMTKLMGYSVDAPVEELHARHKHDETPA